MSEADTGRLAELLAANGARIEHLEGEMERARDALHQLRSEVQAIRYLAERVGELATDVRELTGRIETVAHHALGRPSTGALGVFAQYLAVIVAVTALVVAAHH